MTELLGKSVGEWSANENVNFGGNMYGNNNSTRNCDALILPNWRSCGISLSEWSRRAGANSSLKSKGLTSVQIARYWKKFQDEVQSTFNSSLFIAYALEQNQKEYDASQSQGGTRDGRGRNNTDVNTDRNGNPTTSDDGGQSSGGGSTSPRRNSNTSSTSSVAPKSDNTKYYIYGGIGLAVIVGAFLIFKK
jgi:hypothetical protein